MIVAYKTNIEIDVQEVFDNLRKNEQIDFIKENVVSLLNADDIWELLTTDEQQRIVENYAGDFGYVNSDRLPMEFG